ncbi:gem-associated protein 2-like isoform X2 [Plodia interpunctella]|uniref:gem-associated protein 2-like isoform X2 n=1 Tax=Plodia interpunctella TaxID=58824 RepID=UPI002367C014|nr:gem-associated protein 2-like isoform X2 [Plodia interpunctella]
MPQKKYVYKNHCRDEEESDQLMSPCFQISSAVELKDVPTSGEEYLLKVMQERQKYSTITKCDKDYTKFAKNQSRFIKEETPAQAPERLKPTIEWQNIQVADFSEIRMYVSRIQKKTSIWPSTLKKIQFEHNNPKGWRNFFDKNEPTLSCVLGLQYALLDDGLENLVQILEETKPGDSIGHKTGQWIYAFLACIKQPLLSETISILRSLARRCAEIRSNLNEGEENVILTVGVNSRGICN